jgi:hypothetical protein
MFELPADGDEELPPRAPGHQHRSINHLLMRPLRPILELGSARTSPSRSSRRRSRLLGLVLLAAGMAVTAITVVLLTGAGASSHPTGTHSTVPIRTLAPTTPVVSAPRRPPDRTPVRPIVPAAQIDVLVLNGNAVEGAAGREAALVRKVSGYRVRRVTNAPRQDYPRSVVMYRPGLRKAALRLARKLGIGLVSPLSSVPPADLGRAKLVVITGLQQ